MLFCFCCHHFIIVVVVTVVAAAQDRAPTTSNFLPQMFQAIASLLHPADPNIFLAPLFTMSTYKSSGFPPA
jgi:hypothetical protein